MEKTIEEKAREYGLKTTERGNEFGYSAKYLAYLAGYAECDKQNQQVREAFSILLATHDKFEDAWYSHPEWDKIEAARNALQNIQQP